MQLKNLVLAMIPALAVADLKANAVLNGDLSLNVPAAISAGVSAGVNVGLSTTTCSSTFKVVKTVILSSAPATWAYNGTNHLPTGTNFNPAFATPVNTQVPVGSAGALDATRIAFAGIAGMLVAGML